MMSNRIMLLIGMLFLFLGGCVHAPNAAKNQEKTDKEAVTGSNIRKKRAQERVGNVTKSGVRVIEPEEIERTGEADLGRALKKIVPSAR